MLINWCLPTKLKQYNIKIHSSTKINPIEASLEKNEEYAYLNLLDKRKKFKPKFKNHDLVRTTDIKKAF